MNVACCLVDLSWNKRVATVRHVCMQRKARHTWTVSRRNLWWLNALLLFWLFLNLGETHLPGVAMAMEQSPHALSKTEFDTLTKLLARAHLSGDTAILEKHVEREYYDLASDGLLEKYDKNFTGGMSEAAKRRIEAELESEFEMLDPSNHMDPVEAALEEKHLQDLVEQVAGGNGFVDGRRVAIGQVVVPDGQTDDTWGETICDLPKVKHYDMTYVELREAARRGDQKLRVGCT